LEHDSEIFCLLFGVVVVVILLLGLEIALEFLQTLNLALESIQLQPHHHYLFLEGEVLFFGTVALLADGLHVDFEVQAGAVVWDFAWWLIQQVLQGGTIKRAVL
jgi:hypothetical protein